MMIVFREVREQKNEILERWYGCLTAIKNSHYASMSYQELGPRMEVAFSYLSRCDGGQLTQEAEGYVIELAKERVSQNYYLEELIMAFRTLRKSILEVIEAKHPSIKETEEIVWLFEEVYRKIFVTYLEYQTSIIEAQHKSLLELSTPVIPVDENILVMPLVGTIDSLRANQIMEALLNNVVQYQAEVAIIDLTGVPIVDSGVANHIIRTMQAASLVGGRCILVGIQPEIAQTIIRLGIPFPEVITASNLKKGLDLAKKMLERE